MILLLTNKLKTIDRVYKIENICSISKEFFIYKENI